jgi:predicted nucleic acid-binding protein
MKYFLDTNVCIHYLNNTDAGIGKRVTTLGRKNIYVAAVVIEELYLVLTAVPASRTT